MLHAAHPGPSDSITEDGTRPNSQPPIFKSQLELQQPPDTHSTSPPAKRPPHLGCKPLFSLLLGERNLFGLALRSLLCSQPLALGLALSLEGRVNISTHALVAEQSKAHVLGSHTNHLWPALASEHIAMPAAATTRPGHLRDLLSYQT